MTPHLSADGSPLVLDRDTGEGAFGWDVLDTRDGRVLASVTSPDGWVEAAIDPAATRLYDLALNPIARTAAKTLPPPQLVAVDSTTGAEAGRVALPDLAATLDPLAERTFASYPQLVSVPAVPDTR
jgi:hypothetical protein